MQKYGDPPAAIVEEIGGSINQSGMFSDEGASGENGELCMGTVSLKEIG
jgi:hypothetical protein